MKLQTIALALAAVATVGSAFAQERDVTVTRETPNGTVIRHVERYDHGDRYDHRDRYEHRVIRRDEPRMQRVKVIRRVVWTDHHGNRHIRKVITWRTVPMHGSYAMR